MFNIITILAGLLISPAQAQNITCPTRPAGDSSNACASTNFVKNSIRTVWIDDYGAAHDGVTDDSAAMNRAFTALGSPGGTVNLSCAYNYYIGSNITIPANVTIQHCRGAGWNGNPAAAAGNSIGLQPHVNLSSSVTITLSSNSGYVGVIFRAGATFPVNTPVAYAGTAINLAAGGANDTVIDALIVGFATCVDGTNGGNRFKWKIECDANPGTATGAVIVGNSYDSAWARIRTWPWGTFGAVSPTNTRTGYGTQILSGAQDSSHFDLFDYGHTQGVVTAANGNVHYRHIWTDNNSSYGLQIYGNDRSTFDAVWTYNGAGTRIENNSYINIGYLLCDSGPVIGADCFKVAAGLTTLTNIGFFDVKKAASYAINLESTSSSVNVQAGSFVNVNGGVGPYIVGPVGWTADQVSLGPNVQTDLPAGNSLKGGNPVNFVTLASASPLDLPANGSEFYVTGTTSFSNIRGTWGGRRVRLIFAGALTVSNSATVALQNGQSFITATGSILDLEYDQVNAKWREVFRSPLAQVAQTASASDLSAGTLAIARGGTGTGSPAMSSGGGLTLSGSFPNYTVTNDLAGAWASWTPTIAGTGGTGMTSSLQSATYKNVDKTTFLQFKFTITDAGTGNTGISIASIPKAPTNDTLFFCRSDIVGGYVGYAVANGGTTTAYLAKYDNGNPVVVNSVWSCMGTYQNN